VVEFRKAIDPEITYDRINDLFHKACEEWPGIFKENEDIELAKRHLQVCVGPIEGVRLMGSNLALRAAWLVHQPARPPFTHALSEPDRRAQPGVLDDPRGTAMEWSTCKPPNSLRHR
jgi:hypothetical protein